MKPRRPHAARSDTWALWFTPLLCFLVSGVSDGVNKNQPEDTIKINSEPLESAEAVENSGDTSDRMELARLEQPADGFISLQPTLTGFISWSVQHQFLIGVICTGLCADWVGIFQRHCADLKGLVCRETVAHRGHKILPKYQEKYLTTNCDF